MSGLYIHIPFCKQKCHYCDFHFSVSLRNKKEVLAGIKKELLLRKDVLKDPLETIYFGGGTPSILTSDEIAEILDFIRQNYTLTNTLELTIEANPDDLSKAYLKALKKQGFNRLSIGIQSFFDEDLIFMNRAHTRKEALQTIKTAQEVGFDNITIDLIYGIPGLTNKRWKENIATFLALGIPHLSSYALTVEPNTALDHFIKTKKYPPVEEDLAKQHFDILVATLGANNFLHYELSNFAKAGFLSKHNSAYWQGKSYLGIGPSAHSYYEGTRSWNVSNNGRYSRALQAGRLPLKTEVLTLSNQYNEYIMTGLRTIWGVNLSKVERDFGLDYLQFLQTKIKRHISIKNLKITSDGKLVVTPKAFFLIDGIIADLFWV